MNCRYNSGVFMFKNIALVSIFILSGCAFNPPEPTECEGEFYPINLPENWNDGGE